MSIRDDLRMFTDFVGLTKAKKPENEVQGSLSPIVQQAPASAPPEIPAVAALTPDDDDEDMITELTPQYAFYTDGTPGAFNETARTFVVLDGYTRTKRPRRPDDDPNVTEILLRVEPPPIPGAIELQPEPEEDYATWVRRVVKEGASGRQARDAKVVGPGSAPRPQTTSSANLMGPSSRSFGPYSRNRGVLRANGEIDEG